MHSKILLQSEIQELARASGGADMRDHGIIMQPESVRAILAGTKTVTRRLSKRWAKVVPGDMLWVREEWRVGAWAVGVRSIAVDYRADGCARREWIDVPQEPDSGMFDRLWQQSTDDAIATGVERVDGIGYRWSPGQGPCRWRRGIHMPKWACRLWLEVVSARHEPLQDITEQDAKSEGVQRRLRAAVSQPGSKCVVLTDTYRVGFEQAWNASNPGTPWSSNPAVYRIEFKVREKRWL